MAGFSVLFKRHLEMFQSPLLFGNCICRPISKFFLPQDLKSTTLYKLLVLFSGENSIRDENLSSGVNIMFLL